MSHWRVFGLLEGGLLLWLGFQIVTNPPALIGVVLGALLLAIGVKRHRSAGVWCTIGGITLAVSVMINPAFWLVLFAALVAIIALSSKPSGETTVKKPWQQKRFVSVETRNPSAKAGQVKRHPWFGNETIGAEVFEWDDINLTVGMGDTIIDLGNTFLPAGDNVVVVRKGFGKTRVLVPIGVGVMVDHSAMLGTLTIDDQEFHMQNETVKHFSSDYDDATRRVHLILNVLVGDVEVLRV
ncbi:cell wall-active antibiotics response protein LiaF [Lacticaseibacillus yichunensis]|uniref:Cell wall-active antibiotics response protein LiaF n=1 Tax=Lacticaseibacillus yichunensis TaxID=2486015 RepID=A0ABW4CP90_9LACO|nr:cell wall-active antibiotics response protein LiaF [Lacticaseibacillus yichunensis]